MAKARDGLQRIDPDQFVIILDLFALTIRSGRDVKLAAIVHRLSIAQLKILRRPAQFRTRCDRQARFLGEFPDQRGLGVLTRVQCATWKIQPRRTAVRGSHADQSQLSIPLQNPK